MCARRRTHFLCFAKESKQRKATPAACDPLVLAAPSPSGQPAVLAPRGAPRNSLRGYAAPFRQTRRVSC